MIDQPPVVSVEDVLGAALPADVLARFHSEPDEIGEIDWFEVDRCPLRFVDPASPYHEQDFFGGVFEAVGVINLGAPLSWIPERPSSAFRSAVAMVKSEQTEAQLFKSKNDEDW